MYYLAFVKPFCTFQRPDLPSYHWTCQSSEWCPLLWARVMFSFSCAPVLCVVWVSWLILPGLGITNRQCRFLSLSNCVVEIFPPSCPFTQCPSGSLGALFPWDGIWPYPFLLPVLCYSAIVRPCVINNTSIALHTQVLAMGAVATTLNLLWL